MTITQTVDIPDSRRFTIEVPRETPTGKANVIIQFPVQKDTPPISALPVPDTLPGGNFSTVEEAMEAAAKDAADPNRKPISELFGKHKGLFGGDGVAYQRAIRDEWDD